MVGEGREKCFAPSKICMSKSAGKVSTAALAVPTDCPQQAATMKSVSQSRTFNQEISCDGSPACANAGVHPSHEIISGTQ